MKKRKIQKNRGMTYVELIVVLSIFATVASISLFNYSKFQQKVEIKNLANDIALRLVEAQKFSMNGKLPVQSYGASWKPSYGLYFNLTSNNKSFTSFVDLDQDKIYDSSVCNNTGECLTQVTITKGNYISSTTVYFQDGTPSVNVVGNLALSFTRPSSSLSVVKNADIAPTSGVSYVQISLSSPHTANLANIKVYSSGRIQID